MIETSETFDLAVVLEHRGRLGHGASAVGGERLGIRELVTWDKGLSHIAGNVNGNTIRHFPVVTEVSALHRRRLTLPTEDGGVLGVRQWLRAVWNHVNGPTTGSTWRYRRRSSTC